MNIVWRPASCLHLINRNPSREDDSKQSLFFGSTRGMNSAPMGKKNREAFPRKDR